MARVYFPDYEAYYTKLRDAGQIGKKFYEEKLDRLIEKSPDLSPLAALDLPVMSWAIIIRDYRELIALQDLMKSARESIELAVDKLENIPTFESAIETFNIDNPKVFWLVEEHFSLEEIKTLIFELDYNYDRLPGEEKTSKTRELIKYCQRSDKVRELIANARRRRPNADWESCLYIEV